MPCQVRHVLQEHVTNRSEIAALRRQRFAEGDESLEFAGTLLGLARGRRGGSRFGFDSLTFLLEVEHRGRQRA
jgi:hypothetical protein